MNYLSVQLLFHKTVEIIIRKKLEALSLKGLEPMASISSSQSSAIEIFHQESNYE